MYFRDGRAVRQSVCVWESKKIMREVNAKEGFFGSEALLGTKSKGGN